MSAEYEKALCHAYEVIFEKSMVKTTYLTAYTYFCPGFTESAQLHALGCLCSGEIQLYHAVH